MKSQKLRIIYRLYISLFFIFLMHSPYLLFSQSADDPKDPPSIILPQKTLFSENISYKTDVAGKPLLLDIYRPQHTSTKKLPVVIYVHGGAWAKGDKIVRAESYVEDFILKLIAKNYAVISINYTLVSEHNHFPLPIQDTKDVVRWVRKNADHFNFDVNNIGFFGSSSGAHLSMMAAYTDDNKFVGSSELSSYSAKVNYVVSNFGPTDLNKLLRTRLGKVPVAIVGIFFKPAVEIRQKLVHGISGYDIRTERREAINYLKTVSPINDAENGIPTFIIHGNRDKVAPINHSKRMVRKLKKYNIENALVIVKNGRHGFRTISQESLNQLTDAMVNFIVSKTKN